MLTIKVRTMDTEHGGIAWGEPIELAIETGGTTEEIAQRINRAQALATDAIGQDDPAPGQVIRATGNEYEGIAWIDDLGHQGGTSLILEWHAA